MLAQKGRHGLGKHSGLPAGLPSGERKEHRAQHVAAAENRCRHSGPELLVLIADGHTLAAVEATLVS